MANPTLPLAGAPCVILDQFGNVITSFGTVQSSIQNANGAVTVNSDGSVTISPASGKSTTIPAGGLGITAGGLTVTAGGITVVAGGASVVGGLTADTLVLTGKATEYNSLTTAGFGLPPVVAYGRQTAQSAQVASLTTFTPGADGSFIVSCNVLVTTAGTSTSFLAQLTYTDEGNTARTLSLGFRLIGSSTITTSIAAANGAVPYIGIASHIRAKASTPITVLTNSGGNYGSPTVVYNIEAFIQQVA